MSENDNLETVRSAYAAFARGDIPGLLGLCDPAIHWEHPASPGIPWGGIYQGHVAVQRFFGALGSEVEFSSFEPRSFVAQGGAVIVLGAEKARVRSTGREYQAQWAHTFTLEGGRITRFQEYTDTDAIAVAFRKP